MAYFNPNQPIVQSALTLAPTHLNTQIAKGMIDVLTAKEANDRANAELAMMQELHPFELEKQRILNETSQTRLNYLSEELDLLNKGRKLENAGKEISNNQAKFNYDTGVEDRLLAMIANNGLNNIGGDITSQLVAKGIDPFAEGTVHELMNAMRLAQQRGSTGSGGGLDMSGLNAVMKNFASIMSRQQSSGTAKTTTNVEEAMNNITANVDDSLTPSPNTFYADEKYNRSYAGKNGMNFYIANDVDEEALKAFDKANGTNLTDLSQYSYKEIHPRNRDKQELGNQGTFFITKDDKGDIVIKNSSKGYTSPASAFGSNLSQIATQERWADDYLTERGNPSPKHNMIIGNYHELGKAVYGTSKDGKPLTLDNYFKSIAGDDEKSLVAAAIMSVLNMSSPNKAGLNLQNPKLAKAIHSLIENGKDVSKGKLDNDLKVFGQEANLDITAKDVKFYITAVLDTLNKKNNALNFARDENNVKDKEGNKYPYLQQKHLAAVLPTYLQIKQKSDTEAGNENYKSFKYKTLSEANKANQENQKKQDLVNSILKHW